MGYCNKLSHCKGSEAILLWVRISKKGERCNICVRGDSESLGKNGFVLAVPPFCTPFVRVKGYFRVFD